MRSILKNDIKAELLDAEVEGEVEITRPAAVAGQGRELAEALAAERRVPATPAEERLEV